MKRSIVNVIKIILFIAVFFLINKGFQYILIDDIDSETRITFHEMYEQDNIDVLFIGSSHCYRTFIPSILDEGLNVNSFNAGSSSQPIACSKLILQDAIKNNQINHVYLEVYYRFAFEDRIINNPTGMYIVTDYLNPSIEKTTCMINSSTKEELFNAFIPARREWRNLFNLEIVKNNIKLKNTTDYKEYRLPWWSGDDYKEKGYVANYTKVTNWNFNGNEVCNDINLNDITRDYVEDLNDIIDICKNNNIELTLISAPMSPYLLVQVGNYDSYIDYMNNLAKNNDIEYLDFNLLKEKYFPNTSEVFKDVDHVNDYGARIVTEDLVRYANGEISREDMFYKSYEEKLENISLTVFGIAYEETDIEDNNEEKIIKYNLISNSKNMGDVGNQFKIEAFPEGGQQYIIQEFSKREEFELPKNFTGKVNIKYKDNNGKEEESIITIQ